MSDNWDDWVSKQLSPHPLAQPGKPFYCDHISRTLTYKYYEKLGRQVKIYQYQCDRCGIGGPHIRHFDPIVLSMTAIEYRRKLYNDWIEARREYVRINGCPKIRTRV